MEEPSISNIHNFRPVDERIATAGQPTEAQLAELARDGFQVVINLALHDDPRYSLPDETATVQSLGMEYIHIPVQFATPTESDLQRFFAAMRTHASEKVFIHCAANMRVTAFLGLYFAVVEGRPEEEAFAVMRTMWTPNETWAEFIASALAQRGRAD